MNIKEFNKLLAYIDDNITDKKPVDIIGNCANVCLYWCYDRVKAKHGYKYNKIMNLFNSSYNLTFNQRDKLLSRLEYSSQKDSLKLT